MLASRVLTTRSRAHLLDRLLPHLPPGTEPVENNETPWLGMRGLLLDAPRDVDHVLVVQDDAIVCDRFEESLHRVISCHPHRLLCLFHGGMPGETAKRIRAAPDGTFVELRYPRPTSFTPTVAVVWPQHLLERFARWDATDRKRLVRAGQRGDDRPIGNFSRAHGGALACVPSIVQHPDDVKCTWRGGHVPLHGKDRARVAVRFGEFPTHP